MRANCSRPPSNEAAAKRIAATLDATPAQVALAWLLAHYAGTLLIPGTANPSHLSENLAAGSVRLPSEALAELNGVAGEGG
ncbi:MULTISPECIES: aldo/keto reductase [unclassified Streptomyces]|uniref:aldo/keto reductase n=1 Tax=unclassified Streptomyces TaxID=2593676 RepID=UPI002DDA2E5F|nr:MULTISPECIES: aldo/keto reductase [unclassified Streptomyces]WSA96023.1 aldo/keto reductase [Streptomyces sp. NBC_01795]WSB80438.1 aldo/keto reductase [Streptomyces sp. NBC_01775]WSS11356.1 aldo/keto reductase [Streptomyces sp. NBC_01186]WSS40066.1 aldo/keto reductase [Streptomyces sp. NBC_01187]